MDKRTASPPLISLLMNLSLPRISKTCLCPCISHLFVSIAPLQQFQVPAYIGLFMRGEQKPGKGQFLWERSKTRSYMFEQLF